MASGLSTVSRFKSKLSSYFEAHGRFCASHPWEVIVSIVTLTVCALSMSVLSGGRVGTVCGFSKPCHPKPADEEVADTVMLSIVNTLAVIYIYKQFTRLRSAGSKYLLGIAGLFAIFSSFVFGSTVVNIIDNKVSGLNEALPFFLLLIDLSKASVLAKRAFKSRSRDEVRQKIGEGIASLGPTMTLDTLVEILILSIGTISGVHKFEIMCCFGCLSIIASYLVFMTFFPASLALVVEVCLHDPSNSGWHLDNLAREMQEEEVTKKPNPVAQRVKLIMALGLCVVHVHSWFSGLTGLSFGFGSSLEGKDETALAEGAEEIEMVPLPYYLWWKLFNLSIDQMIAIIFAACLFIKYIFFDKSNTFPSSIPLTSTLQLNKPNSSPVSVDSRQFNRPCPFTFPETTKALVARRYVSSLSANFSIPPTAGTRSGKKNIMIDDRIVTGNASSTLHPVTGGLEMSPQIGSDGGMTRNKFTRCTKMMSHTLGDMSRIKSPLNPAKEMVSIGVQTDVIPPNMHTPTIDKCVFTIGGSDRKEAVGSSSRTGCSEPEEQRHSPLPTSADPRNVDTCLVILNTDGEGAVQLTDTEVIQLVDAKHISAYKLETVLNNPDRGVAIRRQLLTRYLSSTTTMQGETNVLTELPFTDYPHYSIVNGACCENVIGYLPIPVGYAGPLMLDGTSYMVPLATTEGALVASTNRGCRALDMSGGVHSCVLGDGMTRGPVVRLMSAVQASEVKIWLDNVDNFRLVEMAFNQTSRFARLMNLHTAIAGRLLFIRFKATTGDAMGMNMISKGVDKALDMLKMKFPQMEVISISGNFCTDKKPAAINWLEGRGKSVVCEAIIPAPIVTKVLKTSVAALVELNISKNLVGSAMAGSIGGYNAHSTNIVTAIFIATGQDPAQNITSSNCMTLMEHFGPTGEDLHVSCTMPSIELGTVGGGTILPPQGACLDMLGLRGANKDNPGANASQLARVVCATVLAGELSLISALAAGHLVKSHLKHNSSGVLLSNSAKSLKEVVEDACLALIRRQTRSQLNLNLPSIAEGKEVKRSNSVSLPSSPLSTPLAPLQRVDPITS